MPIPVGYQTVTTEPQPLYHNGIPSYGTTTVPVCSVAIGVCPACRVSNIYEIFKILFFVIND